MTDPGRPRRAYDSSRRREGAAETRERILAAGVELLHRYPIWNWQPLTVPAVAHRAEVTERTVYRHFPTERALRDAVLARTAEDVDVDLDAMTLDTVEGFTARVLEYVASFPVKERQQRDPTVVAARERQREALLRAVAASAAWAEPEVRAAAAMLDVLWSVVSFEQLVTEWGMQPQDAIAAITWVIRVLRDAIREDRGPRS
ncbi:TetR/AcrR family transcriptional regulator [Pseudofrankia inefficax]|uniref:Regulatory protein TetR n=1 Tax=Pseudofrankia inefficax (strain DSM 45817 / CECT 9037 / DDB 130130 / EuI1c) TaxID=298654 RepID=E3J9E4_PSEI1|nr:TetR/AcrR family transcriptional regulator [Pseudofrankia inefficax]ADP82163.1 regulatory protein TetR [Pseudofrankia inefficax]